VAALLEEFPFAGHATDEPGVRIMPLVRYPYLVFYAVNDDEAVILHVRHGARLRPWNERQ
jgi:toxin ParE1/3/4